MLLAFSNLQLFQFTKAKHFKKRYNALFEISEARTKAEDLRQILFFVNLVDKPDVVKSARKLFNKITKNLYKVEDVINRPISEIVRRATEAWLDRCSTQIHPALPAELPTFHGGATRVPAEAMREAAWQDRSVPPPESPRA